MPIRKIKYGTSVYKLPKAKKVKKNLSVRGRFHAKSLIPPPESN